MPAASDRNDSTPAPPARGLLNRLRRLRVVTPLRRWPWSPVITGQGLLYILAIIAIGLTAVISANNLLYLLLSAMLAALLVSGLTSRLSLAGLEFRLSWPDRVFAGQPALARVALRNLKSWMPSFSVTLSGADDGGIRLGSIHFPVVARRERIIASAPVTFPSRGRYSNLTLELTTRFPFGFVERRVTLHMREEIVVLPSVESSDESQRILRLLGSFANQTLVGESQDLYRLRPAQPADSARIADWKATARSGELWVREFTSEDRSRVLLYLDRRLPGDASEADFERMLQVCAAIAWRLESMNAHVTLLSDEGVFRGRDSDVSEILLYLALVRPTSERSASPGKSSSNESGPSYTFAVAGQPATQSTVA